MMVTYGHLLIYHFWGFLYTFIFQCIIIFVHYHTNSAEYPIQIPHHIFVNSSKFCYLICLVSLFNGISTFMGNSMPKLFFLEDQQWYYLNHSWVGVWNKGVHTFSKHISLKVNLIPWLEIELSYFGAEVQHFHYYYTTTTPCYFFDYILLLRMRLLNLISKWILGTILGIIIRKLD